MGKVIKHTLYLASLMGVLLAPTVAWANCANPTAIEGSMFYNTTVNAVQFCDGTNWVNTGLKVPTATGTSCTTPTADEGSVYYNTTVNNVQFCNGDNWVNMGTEDYTSATGTACTTPTAPEGSMFYNTTHKRLQFCNGDNWVNATYYAAGYLANLIKGTELYKLTASDGVANDYLGYSVSISGDKALVGAYGDDDNGSGSGSAYIFDVATGAQLHKLTASDGAVDDRFGYSVSISGNKALVGAYWDNDNGGRSGGAYIFDANTGIQLRKLLPDDGAVGDNFGRAVSISGGKTLVGAYRDDDNGTDSGSAYIFDASTGAQLHKLTASDGASDDRFGYSVSISGNKALVGAYRDDDNGTDSGGAYIFDVTTGVQLYKLLPNDGASNDNFGHMVSINGDKAIVSAIGDDDNGGASGSAYIFDVATGAQLHKLLPDDGAASDNFGNSVSISGNKAIVGAYYDDDNGSNSGSAYIFDVATGTQLHKLTANDGAASDFFSYDVSISGNKAIVGAYYDDDNGSSSGSAYIFD